MYHDADPSLSINPTASFDADNRLDRSFCGWVPDEVMLVGHDLGKKNL